MRVDLLGRAVQVRPDGGRAVEVEDEVSRWLVLTLVLDGRVAKHDIARATGLTDNGGAIRQRVSRLKADTGLPIVSDRPEGWRLEPPTVDVDALDFVRLVEKARLAAGDEKRALLSEARALWRGGPPAFTKVTRPAPLTMARVERAYDETLTAGRRILVVDDRIADALAERLNYSHSCEVARSADDYRQQFEAKLADFDLVVLDRHLKSGYRDGIGDEIAESINRRADSVPVFMITFKLPAETELLEWQLQLGLAGAIEKQRDGELASIDHIARAVNELFKKGAVETACDRIQMSMISHRRRVAKDLRDRYSGSQLQARLNDLDRVAARVVERASANDLPGARFERDAFLTAFDGR